jgi:flagellar motility protein MotE (MotC chaperone)
MNQYEMIVLIVLIVIVGRVIMTRLGGGNTLSRREQKRAALAQMLQPQLPDGVSAEEADRMKNEIKRLNERLAVLERIATDPAKRLADEIDSLKRD